MRDGIARRAIPWEIVENFAERKIIHLDMDAFFAAIEQRDYPQFRDKPVIVGGDPWARGVVSTCSYEARKFGIHSAMPSRQAFDLCPHGIFLPGRHEVYRQVSQTILEIMREFSDLVEPLSIDEAFLDVTRNKLGYASASELAKLLKRRIFDATALTASAGVSYNPFLAKVASGLRKPNGLTIIRPQQALVFLERLPIRQFYGIGKVTAARLEALGVRNGADLKSLPRERLLEMFGRAGIHYYELVRGCDDRPIVVDRTRKSLGREITFDHDLDDIETLLRLLHELAEIVSRELCCCNLAGRTLTLKVRYDDFESHTRSLTLPVAINDTASIFGEAKRLLLEKTQAGTRKIRLLGIALAKFSGPPGSEPSWIQTEFCFCGAQNNG